MEAEISDHVTLFNKHAPPPSTPNFEAQIFAAATTPLRDVGKNSLGPHYANPRSAPATAYIIRVKTDTFLIASFFPKQAR